MMFQVSAAARRLSQVKKGALTLAAGAVLGLSSLAANAIDVNFVGFTNGCFNGACPPTSTPGPQTILLSPGLTFNNSTFNATTSGGFLALGSTGATTPAGNFNNLGSFTLTGDPASYTGNSFDLLVTFSAPGGTSPNPFLATTSITGSVTANNQGGVLVDFDNSVHTFSFDTGTETGTFQFFINDVSLNPGKTIGLSGTILLLTATQTGTVPEPETYALFMAGLAAVGFMARRRRKS